MIQTAIGAAAMTWVLVSWLKLFITEKMPIYKYACVKCLCFWSTLAITWEPLTAATAALIAAMVDMYFNNTTITL